MNYDRKQFKEIFCEKEEPICEERVQQTVTAAMEHLIAVQAQEPMKLWEFVYCQSRYINKKWWLLQALLLLVLYGYVSSLQETLLIRQALGIGGPLFIILVIPELWRNQSCNALDIESVTMYTLRQLYAARLALFAGVDLLLLSIFCFGTVVSHTLSIWSLVTQLVLPVNVTCCICLTCLYAPKIGNQTFSIMLCLGFAMIWREIVSNDTFYKAVTSTVWTGMLFVSFVYMAYCICIGQKYWRKSVEFKLVWS